MAVFKGGWIMFVPDAEPAKHRAEIKSEKYEATIVFVKDANQAIEVCQELVQKEGIQSLTLCPAFTHGDVWSGCQGDPDKHMPVRRPRFSPGIRLDQEGGVVLEVRTESPIS